MRYALKEWTEEAKRRFGGDISNWKFVCPDCEHINTGAQLKELDIGPNAMHSKCTGRHTRKG